MAVGTAMAIMGGIQAVGGFMASRRSAKEMRKMRKLMEKQLKFAKERWSHYRKTYGDLEKRMVADAMYGTRGDYEGVRSRAATDVQAQFDKEQEAMDRRNMAYGLNPNSGRFQSSNRQAALAEAATSATAQTNARERERRRVEDDTWNRRYSLGTFGAGLMKSAGNDVMQATTNLGRAHGEYGRMQSELAGNLFANAGMMGMYGIQRMGGAGNAPSAEAAGLDLDTPYEAKLGLPEGSNDYFSSASRDPSFLSDWGGGNYTDRMFAGNGRSMSFGGNPGDFDPMPGGMTRGLENTSTYSMRF